jgi:NDP-sugar pyrophosphorylase family protein
MGEIYYAIAMAGLGRRFAGAGFDRPKYMLPAAGRTLFEHSILSLPLELAAKIFFIALRDHEEAFGLGAFMEKKLKPVLPAALPYELVLLDAPTRGQAETVLAIKDLVPPGAGLAIYNIDTCFASSTLGATLADPAARRDGVIGAFKLKGSDPKWSFARLDGNGAIAETAEKAQISDNALTGFYHFSRAADFFETAELAIRGGETTRGEFYVAPLYNRLIAAGRSFVLDTAEKLIPLGTPEDVAAFEARSAGRPGK